MKRREFIAGVAGAVALPFSSRAQQPGRLPTIGFLGLTAANDSALTTALLRRLRELGWVEGRNLASSIAGRTEARKQPPNSWPSSFGSRST